MYSVPVVDDTFGSGITQWFRRRRPAVRVLIGLLFLLYLGIGIVSPSVAWKGLTQDDTYVLSNEPTMIDAHGGDHLRFERADGAAPTTCTVDPLDGESREIGLSYKYFNPDQGDPNPVATATTRAWWTGEAAVACAEDSRVDVSAPDVYIAGWLGAAGVMMATVPLIFCAVVLAIEGVQRRNRQTTT